MTAVSIRDNRNSGYFWIATELVKRDGKALGKHGIIAYAILSAHADNSKQTAFPSIAKMAEMIGVSQNFIRNGIKELKRLGWIDVEPQYKEGTREQTSNLYTLLDVPELKENDAEVLHGMKGGTSWHEGGGTSPDEGELSSIELESNNYSAAPETPEETIPEPKFKAGDIVLWHSYQCRILSLSDGMGLGGDFEFDKWWYLIDCGDEDQYPIEVAENHLKPAKSRDAFFDAIMELSFNVTPGDKEKEKIHGGRVGRIKSAVIKAGYTEQQYREAVKDFKAGYPDGTVPRGTSSVVSMISDYLEQPNEPPIKTITGQTEEEINAAVEATLAMYEAEANEDAQEVYESIMGEIDASK